MSRFPRLDLLKYPPFLAYAIGSFAAAFGNGLGYITNSWVVVSNHNDVVAMAILMACFWGPNVILGPFMGVLADRFSRKKMIIFSNAARAGVFIAFSFYLRNHFHVGVVYVMMLCVGTAFSAFFSSAMAFTRELVPEEKLIYANSVIDINYEVGNVLGLGLAGLLIFATSAPTAIFINGIAFVIALVTMFFIPQHALCHGGQRTPQPMRIIADFREGLSYLGSDKKLILTYALQLLIMLTFLSTPLLLAPFSKTILHATVAQFGAIEACASVGIIIGGLLMPWITLRFGFFNTVLFFTTTLTLIFSLFGYNHSILIAEIFYFIIGFSGAVWVPIITRAQSLTHIDFQGRVQSTFNSLSGIGMIAFYACVGGMGNISAVQHLYWLEAIVTLLGVWCLLKYRM